MRKSNILHLSVAALAAVSANAQSTGVVGPATVFFSMDNTVQLNSANMTNQVSIVADEGILSFSPGSIQRFASVYTDFNTWTAYLGDEDNDALWSETTLGSIDAIWLRDGTPPSPSIHEIYFSIQTPVEPDGFVAGGIRDGDIVRIKRDGTLETFLSQGQVSIATGGSSTNLDINGFTVDESNGDLYMTFTAAVDIAGTPLDDGGILRIPGSAYTPSGGVVTAMIAGSAEIVLTEPEIDAFFLAAGSDGITDCTGIEIDPTGGMFTSSVTGLTVPNLWLCDDDNSDESIITTQAGGTVAIVNGFPMTAGPNMGLAPMDPFGGTNDNPFGIAFLAQFPNNATPMLVDQFPGAFTTPTTVNIDVGGATPFGSAFLLLEIADGTVMGGSTPRLGNVSGLFPFPLASTSWDVFFTTGSIATIPLVADGEGYATFPLTLPPITANLLLLYQAFDIATLQFSAPCLVEAN